MSRIAKYPVAVPDKVQVTVNANEVVVKGPLGTLTQPIGSAVVVKLEDILWLEASNFYTVLHLRVGKQIVATRTLKDFEEMLGGSDFQRIHRSHMINLMHLERYIKGAGGQVVMAGGKTLDVSRTQKDELLVRMGRR